MGDRTLRYAAQSMRRHWAAAGSPEKCVANIVTHLNALLSDDEKAKLNWHDRQSVDLVVMRLIAAWQDAGAPDYVPKLLDGGEWPR
jgi:hypothetical protein